MEAIDTQHRFEELVSELERLKDAADLVEENTFHVRELREHTTEVVGALGELVPVVKQASDDSGAAVEEGARTLRHKADQLDDLKEDFDTFLGTTESDHQKRLEALSETLDAAVEHQKQLLEQYAEERKAELRSIREAFADVTETMQSVEKRLADVRKQAEENHQTTGAAFEKVAGQQSTGQQAVQNAVTYAREQVTSHVDTKQSQFWKRVNAKFERGERAVLALLVLQGLTVALIFLLYLTG